MRPLSTGRIDRGSFFVRMRNDHIPSLLIQSTLLSKQEGLP